jgi:hypothetical protein
VIFKAKRARDLIPRNRFLGFCPLPYGHRTKFTLQGNYFFRGIGAVIMSLKEKEPRGLRHRI